MLQPSLPVQPSFLQDKSAPTDPAQVFPVTLSPVQARRNQRNPNVLLFFPSPGLSTYGGTLCQLLRGCYLDIEVFGLRLPSGFDEPLKYLVLGEEEEELEGPRKYTK